VEERHVDSQGRVSLPADWRRENLDETGNVLLFKRGEEIVIRPKRTRKLSEFFDSVEVDLSSDLSNWHSVKRELLGQ
jgi:AbrB family looped-hinge helix DNA binding protein